MYFVKHWINEVLWKSIFNVLIPSSLKQGEEPLEKEFLLILITIESQWRDHRSSYDINFHTIARKLKKCQKWQRLMPAQSHPTLIDLKHWSLCMCIQQEAKGQSEGFLFFGPHPSIRFVFKISLGAGVGERGNVWVDITDERCVGRDRSISQKIPEYSKNVSVGGYRTH